MKLRRCARWCLLPPALLVMLGAGRALVFWATAERPASCHYAQAVAVPTNIQPYIMLACFNRDEGDKGGAPVLTHRGAAAAALPLSQPAEAIARYLVEETTAWLGDRPAGSVAREIRWHARAGKYRPIQIQYRCADLDWFERRWQCDPGNVKGDRQ